MVWNVGFAEYYCTGIDKALHGYGITLREVVFEPGITRGCGHADDFEYILHRHGKPVKRPPALAPCMRFVCFCRSNTGALHIQGYDSIDFVVITLDAFQV